MPGARQQGFAASTTGVIDELYTVYANPGAAGFLREWQWSASYSRWIADVYSASAFYGRRWRMPWSAHTRVGLGMAYQGMPEFDSSDRAAPQVSASDMVFTASMGQPFSLWKRDFSFGANVKYFNSELAQFEANSWVFDVGLLYRSPRFQLFRPGSGVLEYAIVSAGVAWTNLGEPLTYLATATPLPHTWRAGMALQAGTHEGLQVQLAIDYHQTREENSEFSMGAEISWSQFLSVRGGYDFENQLISPVAFGLSVRLDDRRMPAHSVIPGRNNALRFDLATTEDNLLFSRPYRGSITHHTLAPAKFQPLGPEFGIPVETDSVVLAWETSQDPDLYDEVRYWLIVDQDSLKMASLLQSAERDEEEFFSAGESEVFLANLQLNTTRFVLQNLAGGNYYWTVAAFDRDRHLRFIEKDGRRLQVFRVAVPQAEITSLTFGYHPWITEDDFQGALQVTIANTGGRSLATLSWALYDSLAAPPAEPISARNGNDHQPALLGRASLDSLASGETRTVTLEWRTAVMGQHVITAVLDEESAVLRREQPRRRYTAAFHTIPKGRIAADDPAIAFILSRVAYDVPFIPEICFDPNSAEVKKEYHRDWVLEPPLQTIAARLKAHPEVAITLQGFADPNSGERDAALADARAQAVRDSLLQLGVRPAQIKLLPGQVLPERRTPVNPDDARWVKEERRHVEIAAETASEAVIFDLVSFDDFEPLPQPVIFRADVKSAVPIGENSVELAAGELKERLHTGALARRSQLFGDAVWRHHQNSRGEENLWREKTVTYGLTLSDSLGRQFRTPARQVHMSSQTDLRAQRVAWPIKFNATAPLYDFYWQRMFEHVQFMLGEPTMRMRLSGHACAIGPEAINLRLSQQRAEVFQRGFLQLAKERYPQAYQKILDRLVSVKGFGESKPLGFDHLQGRQIIKGDNQTPLGRKLNRRIEVEFYYPEKE